MTTGWIPLSSNVAQLLLAFSPLALVLSVIRTPRLALYFPSETLILLTFVYLFRYDDLLATSAPPSQILHATHLSFLIWATIIVAWYQSKAFLPGKPISNTEAAEEKETEQLTSETKQRVRKFVAFNRGHFCSLLFWSLLPTLYSGSHSLVGRAVAAYFDNKPLPSFWSDAWIQLTFASTLLENNALVYLYSRLISARRASATVPPPSDAQLEAANLDLDTYRQRLQTPKCIWAFVWLTALGAAGVLPEQVRALMDKKADEMDPELYRVLGSGVLVLFFGVFLVVYWRMGRRGIQLPKDEEDQPKSDGAA